MIKNLFYFLITLFTLGSCGGKDENMQPVIDVSQQWVTDQNGNILASPADGQWAEKVFTAAEMNLFNSLDTVSLANTVTPASVADTGNYPYPNPFTDTYQASFSFASGYSGQFIFKYVIVDEFMQAQEKKSVRLQANANRATIAVWPAIAAGKFRLYYTLSSESNPHFFKSWGNIQKNL